MLRSLLSAAVLLTSVSASPALEVERVLTWDDLVPAASPMVSPLEKLSLEVRKELAVVLQAKLNLQRGFIDQDNPGYQMALQIREKLEKRGIDVIALEAELQEAEAEFDRRNEAVVAELDGKTVRIPGYALPLEMSEDGVKELLLVPYLGACIHTPPPPPNQMVYVRLNEESAFEGLYEPVWITGRMIIQPTSVSLSYVDGTAQIAAGYTMAGITVEPFE